MSKQMQPAKQRKRDKRHEPFAGKISSQNDIRRVFGFETVIQSKKEVNKRLQLMDIALKYHNLMLNERDQIQALQAKLATCRKGKGQRCTSPGCSVCSRGRRKGHIQQALTYMKKEGLPNLACVTLLSKNWVLPCNQLPSLAPQMIFNSVRRQLKLAGLWQKYAAFGFLDGQFIDIPIPEYHVHIHFVIPYKDYKDLLPHLKLLRSKFYTRKQHGNKFYRPMVVTRCTARTSSVENLMRRLSYNQKSFWCRKIKVKGKSKMVRIPEPYHTLQLVWLDQHLPSQIRFLFGCKIYKHKLIRTF